MSGGDRAGRAPAGRSAHLPRPATCSISCCSISDVSRRRFIRHGRWRYTSGSEIVSSRGTCSTRWPSWPAIAGIGMKRSPCISGLRHVTSRLEIRRESPPQPQISARSCPTAGLGEQAVKRLEHALRVSNSMGERTVAANTKALLGRAAARSGKVDEARDWLTEASAELEQSRRDPLSGVRRECARGGRSVRRIAPRWRSRSSTRCSMPTAATSPGCTESEAPHWPG